MGFGQFQAISDLAQQSLSLFMKKSLFILSSDRSITLISPHTKSFSWSCPPFVNISPNEHTRDISNDDISMKCKKKDKN